MLKEIKTDTIYRCTEDDKEICVIEDMGENTYHAHNIDCDIIAKVERLDSYRINTSLISHKRAGKDGKYRKTTKLMRHNLNWLVYMLQTKGFIEPIKAI